MGQCSGSSLEAAALVEIRLKQHVYRAGFMDLMGEPVSSEGTGTAEDNVLKKSDS